MFICLLKTFQVFDNYDQAESFYVIIDRSIKVYKLQMNQKINLKYNE